MNERNTQTPNDETGIEAGDTQLTIRRTFDALRERKWRAVADDGPTVPGGPST